jgi:hypothetical protein
MLKRYKQLEILIALCVFQVSSGLEGNSLAPVCVIINMRNKQT